MIDLMIIGTEKSATTALLNHLNASTRVYIHEQSEFSYFSSTDEFRLGWDSALKKYLPKRSPSQVTVAKDVMLSYSRAALERLHAQCPNVKCVIMLREPVSRAYSAFNHARLKGLETCTSFEMALSKEAAREAEDPQYWNSTLYVRNSRYAEPLSNAFEIFGRDNVCVLLQEDYRDSAKEKLANIESFLGKQLFNHDARALREHNTSSRPRFVWLAQLTSRIFKSKAPWRRLLRKVLPPKLAHHFRRTLVQFNRVEAAYPVLDDATAAKLRERFRDDKEVITRLLGTYPW